MKRSTIIKFDNEIIKSINERFKLITTEFFKSFLAFAERNNYQFGSSRRSWYKLDSYAIMDILSKMGFVIEVQECSNSGDITDGTHTIESLKDSKHWHRTHQYRWSIAEYDELGNMFSLKYNQEVDNINRKINEKLFNSYIDCLNDAIMYIIINY